ncbi:MAG: hypothetical protein LBB29_02180 [Holosporaceae bacterium]|jgi:hypothetical protein|nr:hypothetical protein [Holosporaceae bacterium]
MSKFIIGILSVVCVFSWVLADTSPETVIISTAPNISVTINKSDVNEDDGNITINSVNTCSDCVTYRFDISAINNGQNNYLQSRYVYLRPGKNTQEWDTHLIGLYDKNDDVKYRLDVCKDDAHVASAEISAKGVKKLDRKNTKH